MAKRPYPHRIEKTKNKHSRAVFREDTIIIRLARNLSYTEKREHIEDLLDRMTKQLLEEERYRVHIHPFKGLLSGKQKDTIELATGKKYEIALQAGEKLSAIRTRKGWKVSVSPRTRRAQLHRFLWNLIAEAEYDRIVRLVESANKQTLNVRIKTVRFRFASSQWGSCSPKGIIMLNAALLFAPASLLRYVTIHELAHRKRADHSASYWRIVEDVLPGYQVARNRLQNYRLPTL
jgi:predicted metal-dependent hydrolase|tara:strand:+ start:90 stop:791 length:702 start_codon:yes stop_codon:yes gene_type:complete